MKNRILSWILTPFMLVAAFGIMFLLCLAAEWLFKYNTAKHIVGGTLITIMLLGTIVLIYLIRMSILEWLNDRKK